MCFIVAHVDTAFMQLQHFKVQLAKCLELTRQLQVGLGQSTIKFDPGIGLTDGNMGPPPDSAGCPCTEGKNSLTKLASLMSLAV